MSHHTSVRMTQADTLLTATNTADKQLTQLLQDRAELGQISLVLPLVLHLLLDTLQDPDGRGVVVALARCPERRIDHFGGGHEIVRKAVVEPTLQLKQVGAGSKKDPVPLVEGVERLGLVRDGCVLGGSGIPAEGWEG
jgi:hypothetical protein